MDNSKDSQSYNKIITRFAPSPTGLLHIGGARTALFNLLYTKHVGGKFLLRIEDTDKARSTDTAVDAIIKGLMWLDIKWDEDIVFQSTRMQRHKEVGESLLEMGVAYRCYLSQDEIEDIKSGNQKVISPWRDPNYPKRVGVEPVIRLKANLDDITIVEDKVQGRVEVHNSQLDDMVLLRSDGTPTYMLAVVVDDHDMKVNSIIRGDDHFTNTFRQLQIYKAMKWDIPEYAHIPLIHGQDGGKLSKRHGAVSVEVYKDLGYLPEAICNYLLRLGWGHGDVDIISRDEVIKIFNIFDIGKSPSRFDIDKLNHINSHYIRSTTDEALSDYTEKALKLKKSINSSETIKKRIHLGMHELKIRVKTLKELEVMASIYIKVASLDEKSASLLRDEYNLKLLPELICSLKSIENWSSESIKNACAIFAEMKQVKISVISQLLRAKVIGTFASPPLYEVLEILSQQEVIERLEAPLQ